MLGKARNELGTGSRNVKTFMNCSLVTVVLLRIKFYSFKAILPPCSELNLTGFGYMPMKKNHTKFLVPEMFVSF